MYYSYRGKKENIFSHIVLSPNSRQKHYFSSVNFNSKTQTTAHVIIEYTLRKAATAITSSSKTYCIVILVDIAKSKKI